MGLAVWIRLLRLVFRDPARIAELGEHILVLVEIADGGFVGNGQDDLVAPLFGLSDFPELRARRGLGQGFEIAGNVFGVGKLARFAGNAAEEFQGRRHGAGGRHVVHQLGGDAGVLQILMDEPGVLFVLRLGRGGGLFFRLRQGGRACQSGGEQQARGQGKWVRHKKRAGSEDYSASSGQCQFAQYSGTGGGR